MYMDVCGDAVIHTKLDIQDLSNWWKLQWVSCVAVSHHYNSKRSQSVVLEVIFLCCHGILDGFVFMGCGSWVSHLQNHLVSRPVVIGMREKSFFSGPNNMLV